jgi:thiamine-monophosphate kinase
VGSPKPGHTQHLVEDETLERIRHALRNGILAAGLRDDAAVLEVPGGGSLVVSMDSTVEGVHVDLALCQPADVGWKALMGALSDLAAMGARPLGALVALCVPEGGGTGDLAVGVMEGVAEASRASGCPVVGGDVSSASNLVVSVTVLGTVEGGEPVPRDGARPGDLVLVTGPCGGSAAGLRVLRAAGGGGGANASLAAAYRRPVARLAEGMVARLAGAAAMMDVSDGLALDLHRLATASGVGFALDDVPVVAGATLDEALGGGEDYELVLVIGPDVLDGMAREFARKGLRPPLPLGVMTYDVAQREFKGRSLPPVGWQHLLG